MIPVEPAQLAAYAADILLVVCAWRFPRTRWYIIAHLALDLVRFGLSFVPCGPRPFVGVDFALLLLDGALLLLPAVIMSACMTLNWTAVMGLVAVTMGYVAHAYPTLQGETLERFYVASMASAHLYFVCAPIASRKWRRCAGIGDYVLLALAATGLVGAFVALAWPAHWTLVNAGNITAQALLCVFCLLMRSRNDVQ